MPPADKAFLSNIQTSTTAREFCRRFRFEMSPPHLPLHYIDSATGATVVLVPFSVSGEPSTAAASNSAAGGLEDPSSSRRDESGNSPLIDALFGSSAGPVFLSGPAFSGTCRLRRKTSARSTIATIKSTATIALMAIPAISPALSPELLLVAAPVPGPPPAAVVDELDAPRLVSGGAENLLVVGSVDKLEDRGSVVVAAVTLVSAPAGKSDRSFACHSMM